MKTALEAKPTKGPVVTETLLEVTEWEDGTPNHTYLIDKDKGHLLAYRKAGSGEITVFSTALKTFSKSNRKFKKVVDKELEGAIL